MRRFAHPVAREIRALLELAASNGAPVLVFSPVVQELGALRLILFDASRRQRSNAIYRVIIVMGHGK